jgi:hypothetical protein
MRGIILEGVVAAGKSTVLGYLQRRITTEKAGSTKLFISEHYTQRVLEGKPITAEALRKHIDILVHNLSAYQHMLEESPFAAHPSRAEAFVTMERFLLTFFATYPHLLQEYGEDTARQQFRTLARCGLVHYLIVLPPERVRANISQTLTHRNQAWATHLDSMGGLEEAVQKYIEWQAKLITLSRQFQDCIQTEIITLHDQSYESIAEGIYADAFC